MPKKKKIKDNYIVRTKKRILRETADSEAKYKTTFKDIRTYFKIFNKSLFKNKLNPFNDVKIKRIVRGSGQCVEYISYRKKMEFLNTLSHEMVHLWQQTIKKDTGNHNKLFFSFRNKFKKLNLKLSY